MTDTAKKIEAAQHTPGPWYFDEVRNVREESTDYCVATIHDDSGHVDPEYSVPLPRDANARLIAAAPETAAERDKLKEINAELLEALEIAINLTLDDEDIAHNAFLKKARAAIAKAKGE